VTTKQRRAQRIRQELRTGATGGIGYGARTGQIIRGALGRGAGGRFERAAERETLRERNERLRVLLAQIRAYLRTSAGQAAGKRAAGRSSERRQTAAQRRARNRRDTVERIVSRGWLAQAQAGAFLAFIEGTASDEQQAALEALGLVDEDGKLTRAGRLLKTAYDTEKLDMARRALEMAETTEEKAKASRVGDYRSALRSAIRGLWTGVSDFDGFFEAMVVAIERHITLAWYAGAKDCGVLPDELTRDERIQLQRAINYEKQWITGFGLTIEEGSKANGGLLRPLFSRAEIWIGRWEGTRDAARAMACRDKKLKWTIGSAREHCGSCLKLNGKVKRASFWSETGILPRTHGADFLECNGFR
jgi:hypothetical protein